MDRYIYIVSDAERANSIMMVTTDAKKAIEELKKCKEPELEIWTDGRYVDDVGILSKFDMSAVLDKLRIYRND